MSRNCCNNNCCNPCDGYGNSGLGFGGSWLYTLAALLLFGGGGFGPGSFFGAYDKVFRCSGFNNGWCNNTDFNNSNFNTGNYTNSNFSGNNTSNSNLIEPSN